MRITFLFNLRLMLSYRNRQRSPDVHRDAKWSEALGLLSKFGSADGGLSRSHLNYLSS